MKIEHAAYQVEDPVAIARWYVEHLGMTVMRAIPDSPFAHFLADDGHAVMLEFYRNPRIPVPDYRTTDPIALHVAFKADDVGETRRRLIAAGATPVGDVLVSDAGDEIAMLRDPWGLPIQFIRRKDPMI